jgi:hypothetical protein
MRPKPIERFWTLLVVLFFLARVTVQGQDIYFGAGYSVSYWPLKGLNNVIDQYEESRKYYPPSQNPEGESTSSTGSINLLSGFSASFGYLFKSDMNLEVKYMNRGSQQWTSQVITDKGGSFERAINVNTNSLGFGISKLFPGKKRDFIMGGTINFTNLSLDLSESSISDYGIVNQTMIGFMIFSKFIYKFGPKSPLGFSFNPYLHFNLTDVDFSQLNKAINPITYNQISSNEVQGARLNLGMEVQLVYFVYTKFNKGE